MTPVREDKAETTPAKRNQNQQCISCGRQCYNTGLCMMPWPGLHITEEKAQFAKLKKKQQPRPDRTCRSHHPLD